MDIQTKILLNTQKNINSINVDMANKIELSNTVVEINEYNINNVVNASDVFEIERQNNAVYRIYGRIEFMSLLNGLKLNYVNFKDFFLPQKNNCKTILNSFDFYLVRPASLNYPYTKIVTDNTTWIRYYEVIASPDNFSFDIYPAGFSNNVYGEQEYTFNFNVDIDISNYYDYFNFPLTELFLYAKYKPRTGGSFLSERLLVSAWNDSEVKSEVNYDTIAINDGDVLKTNSGIKIGDLVEYGRTQYYQTQKVPQTFYILTPISDTHTYSLTFTCYVYAEAFSSGEEVVSAETIAYISTDNGINWTSVARAWALAKNGNNDSDEKEINYTINNIDYNNLDKIKVKIEGDYSYGDSNGNGTITITDAIDATGSLVDIVCNNIYNFAYDSAILDCDIISQSSPNSLHIFFSQITNNISGINKTVLNGESIKWKYNPLIPLQLRYLGSSLNQANTGTSYYDIVQSIPTYATKLDDTGNYVWRDIMPEGYFDVLTGKGNDIPFINNNRYFFTSIILDIVPDMDDIITRNKFSEIWYTKNSKVISKTPMGDINDLGKPCK